MNVISEGTIYRQFSSLVRLSKKAYGPFKLEILQLTALGFLSGLLEGVGINAVIPLLTLVLGVHDAATDTLSEAMLSVFKVLHIPFVPRYLLLFIVILFFGKFLVSLYLTFIQIRITTEYDRATRAKTFTKVLHASWPYLLKQKIGNLETLLMVDVPISTSLLLKLAAMIQLITSVVMYLIVAFSIAGLITLITIILGALVFFAMRPIMDRVHKMAKDRATLYRDTMHHVTEHVSGLKTVKAMHVEDAAIEKGYGYFNEIKDFGRRIQFLQQLAAQLIPPIGMLYIAAILSLAFKTSFISIAALPAVLYLIYRVFSYIQQMQNNIQAIIEYIPHLERVVTYEASASETAESTHGSKPFIFKDSLNFDRISFSYEMGKGVLHDVSFNIKKGTMVGIVGPSGAGKTTCVDLILRLLEPTAGTILLDGMPCADISLSQWRRSIAYVSQDFFILHGTIRENIQFYDTSISDDHILAAAKAAHIDGFIRESKDGLDTQVGDRGIMLSAGQRQRITIARALARKPQILILDEATSALDNESEAHIKEVIEELKGRITIIAIAHRLSTIIGSDSLVVLQEGKVVETGSPKALLGDTESYFYKVYTISQ